MELDDDDELDGEQIFTVTVPGTGGAQVTVATGGYTPLAETVGPAQSSLACRIQTRGCNFTAEFQTAPATLTTDAACAPLTACS